MYIKYKSLSRDMDSILDETPMNDLLELAFGDKIDDNIATRIAHTFYTGVIVEELYKKQQSYWGTIYKDALDAKNDLCYEESKMKKKGIEDNSASAISEFLSLFDDFGCDDLTREIRKSFRQYKFREINRVNDYTILYFTYRLYEMYLDENTDCENETVAKRFAKMARDRLNSNRGKKQTTVTSDNLATFVRQSDVLSPNYSYVKIFLSFIQDVYFSDIDDVLLYAIFSRFSTQLLVMNTFLSVFVCLKRKNKRSKRSIEHKEPKTINKYVSNQKRSLQNKEDEEAENIKKLISGLQKGFRQLPKEPNDLSKKTTSKYHKTCSQIYEYIKQLSNYLHTKRASTIKNVITSYSNLYYEDGNNSIGMYNLVAGGLMDEAYRNCSKLLKRMKFTKHYLGGNIFLQLLFSTMVLENEAQSIRFNSMSDEIIAYIKDKIGIYVSSKYINEEKKAYADLIECADLDILNPPILDLKLLYSEWNNEAILYLENILF